jgi:hypothetical protein
MTASDFPDEIPDVDHESVPWPKQGDRLFISTGSAYEAPIASESAERLYHIMEGYKDAADILVAHTEKVPSHRRRLVYPIVYCYRHYLEIALKGLIISHGPAVNVALVAKDHNLFGLWRKFRTIVEAHGQGDATDGNDKPLDAVEANIKEFNKLDPAAMTFRYHATTKDKQFTGVPHSVDLAELKRVMDNIWMLLEAADMSLEHSSVPPDHE